MGVGNGVAKWGKRNEVSGGELVVIVANFRRLWD